MKKITLAALCAASAIYAGAFETWIGAEFNPRVETGLGNETDTYGRWFDYSDNDEGGGSRIIFPVEMNSELSHCEGSYIYCQDLYIDMIIEYCYGVCGTVSLDKGSLTPKPFSGIGFSIVGETSTTNKALAAGDAFTWGGLCVTYSSDTDISLELGLGNTIDSTMNYALPAVKLPASKKDHRIIASWSDFKQPSWYDGSVKFDGETAAKQLVTINFKFQADPGEYDFNICAVGPKDGTCPEECKHYVSYNGIKVTRGSSTVNAVLNGRTLRFTGIKSTATVEVMNSLGQIVMKNAINNATNKAATLNLTSLKAGIYMVHVNGKNVNFAKKIVLR